MQVDPLPLVGEGRISLHVFEERHVAGPDGGRKVGLELVFDPHRVGEVDHVVDPLHLPDLDRRDVARVEDRSPRRDVTHAAVVKVSRPVAVEVGRAVVEDRRPGDLVVAKRGFVDVGLEGRTWLPLREDDVELTADRVVSVVRGADPRQNRAVFGVGGQQCRVVDVHD